MKNVYVQYFWLLVTLVTPLCYAQTPLSVVEQQEVMFGMINDNANRCTMNESAILSGDCFGTGYLGEMVVTGDPYTAFNVTVASVGWVNDAKFSPKLVNQNYILDATGRFVVLVIGTMQLKIRGAYPSAVHMTYNITVYYQ